MDRAGRMPLQQRPGCRWPDDKRCGDRSLHPRAVIDRVLSPFAAAARPDPGAGYPVGRRRRQAPHLPLPTLRPDRRHGYGHRVIRFADCELNLDRVVLRRGGEEIRVEPQVFDVLAYLVKHRGAVVRKEELLDAMG